MSGSQNTKNTTGGPLVSPTMTRNLSICTNASGRNHVTENYNFFEQPTQTSQISSNALHYRGWAQIVVFTSSIGLAVSLAACFQLATARSLFGNNLDNSMDPSETTLEPDKVYQDLAFGASTYFAWSAGCCGLSLALFLTIQLLLMAPGVESMVHERGGPVLTVIQGCIWLALNSNVLALEFGAQAVKIISPRMGLSIQILIGINALVLHGVYCVALATPCQGSDVEAGMKEAEALGDRSGGLGSDEKRRMTRGTSVKRLSGFMRTKEGRKEDGKGSMEGARPEGCAQRSAQIVAAGSGCDTHS